MVAAGGPADGRVGVAVRAQHDEVQGYRLVRLELTLTVRDARGQAVATRRYEVRGASLTDHATARRHALQQWRTEFDRAGPLQALGFTPE